MTARSSPRAPSYPEVARLKLGARAGTVQPRWVSSFRWRGNEDGTMEVTVPTDDPPDEHQQADRAERVPDPTEPTDPDHVTERTAAPSDGGDTGFDPDAPGNFVDDRESAEVPEPNEPA
jgi:hypothetical protein